MRSRLIPSVALATCLLATGRDASTQTPASGDAAVVSALRERIEASGLAEKLGVEVRDAVSGRVVFQHRATTPMNPASNQKLVTAAAALALLGAETRFTTGAYGRVEGDAVTDLVIEGHGDPSLTQGDLLGLAQALHDRGIRRVERILVDGDHFDDVRLPPAFEQQPNTVATFRAAIGGLVVDKAAFAIRVTPGAAVGQPATVRVRGAGYFDVTAEVTTSDEEDAVVASAEARPDGRMKLRVTGHVRPSGSVRTYRQRVEHPVLYAGHLFADALGAVGIRGARAVALGGVPAGTPLLAEHASEPLAELLGDVGKDSDNFVAEMILRHLGARKGLPATSAHGAEVVTEFLTSVGVPAGQATVVNGSGLFRGNRIAAAHLAAVLGYAYRTPAIRNEYLTQLAIAGVDGTLARRMDGLAAARTVRAKTGTLDTVYALSGYALSADPGRAFVFSFLANEAGGQGAACRALFDAMASDLAARLEAR